MYNVKVTFCVTIQDITEKIIIIISGKVWRPLQASANRLISPKINIYKICLLTQTAQVFVSERQLH